MQVYEDKKEKFRDPAPLPSERNLMALAKVFQDWVIERREALQFEMLDLERTHRNQAPMVASLRSQPDFAAFVAEYQEGCLRLAEIQSDLAILDLYYVEAKNRETETLPDLANPGMRLLWEWFLRSQG